MGRKKAKKKVVVKKKLSKKMLQKLKAICMSVLHLPVEKAVVPVRQFMQKDLAHRISQEDWSSFMEEPFWRVFSDKFGEYIVCGAEHVTCVEVRKVRGKDRYEVSLSTVLKQTTPWERVSFVCPELSVDKEVAFQRARDLGSLLKPSAKIWYIAAGRKKEIPNSSAIMLEAQKKREKACRKVKRAKGKK